MDLNLKGKVALVTGGMSGIGRSIVGTLVAEGCDVHVGDLNVTTARVQIEGGADCMLPTLAAGAAALPQRGGIRASGRPRGAHVHQLDVGDAEGVQQVVDSIIAERGHIDILVNCAGILKTRPLVESTIADWDDVARVNLSGVYYCSRTVMPGMIARRYGKIVNIASVSSVKGGGQFGNVLYGATKAGVVAMTQGFARELGPYGINVNAVSPGVVETAMTSTLMTAEVRDRIVDSIPLKRMIQPAEIAQMVAYLASDASKGVTGQALVVDAGFLVR